MPSELFANIPTTTVASGATTTPAAGTSETWTVASSTGFPAASNTANPKTQFRARIDSELVTVTHVSGTTWTVTRGADGSTVASHANGTEIRHVVTAEVLGGSVANVDLLVASSTAPADVKARANYVCGALNAEVQINLAITAVNALGGGVVRLTAGAFNIGNFNTNGIRMRRKVELVGAGRDATTLVAGGTWAGHDAIAQGGCIEPLDNTQDRWAVRALTITAVWGDHDVRGIYANISSNTGFVYGDDSMLVFADLYIRGMKRAGLDVRGAYSRKNVVNNVQIFDMGDATFVVDGVFWDSNDSHFFALDVGDCTGYGVHLQGPNNRFVASKAFYSGLSGWRVTGVRNELSACEAQDNLQHGFTISGADNTLSACMADSNSYDKSPSGAITGRSFHGFHVAAVHNTLAACNAKDKNEGGRGVRQVYGFYLDTGVERVQLHGIANDNFTGILGGPGVDGAFNNIQITGSQGGVNANAVRFVGSAMGSEISFWRSESTATPIAQYGLNLASALTEWGATFQHTRKVVDTLDVGSAVALSVTVRKITTGSPTTIWSIRDTSNTANVLVSLSMTWSNTANQTRAEISAYAAKPSWYTASTTLALYSEGGDGGTDFNLMDVTVRQRP